MSSVRQVELSKIVLHSARHALTIQKGDGSFPAGHNGRYFDPETPVRNTAHWLFLFASLYIKIGEIRWKKAGEKAINYLTGSKARPFGKSFHCREKAGKDKCNGLVGQAWVIEALVKAAEAFGRDDCYELAEVVFLLHPWDSNLGIWNRVEVDGTVLSYDRTFNHQLWFAAAGGLLTQTPVAQERAEAFLEKVAKRVQLYANGVIFHASSMGDLADYFKHGIKPFLKEVKSRIGRRIKKRDFYSKSVGYHGFNLYAFAMLKNIFPDAPIWKSQNFNKLLISHRREEFLRDINKSEFGYYYNVSGIEIALAVEVFFRNNQEATLWLNRQMEETYLSDTQCLSLNAPDQNTAMARIYQAARLSENYEVGLG